MAATTFNYSVAPAGGNKTKAKASARLGAGQKGNNKRAAAQLVRDCIKFDRVTGKMHIYGLLADQIMRCQDRSHIFSDKQGQKVHVHSATIVFHSNHNPAQVNDRC